MTAEKRDKRILAGHEEQMNQSQCDCPHAADWQRVKHLVPLHRGGMRKTGVLLTQQSRGRAPPWLGPSLQHLHTGVQR
jgi:hypothetical protein